MRCYRKAIQRILSTLGTLVFFSFVTASVAQATTYYVDKNSVGGTCNDTNNGTALATPFCTFTKAHSVVSAGDTVYFRAATNYPAMLITKSGSLGNYLTFARYASETVVVDAAGANEAIRATSTTYVEINGFETKNAVGSGSIYLKGQPNAGADYTLTLSSHNRIINNISHDNLVGASFTHGIYLNDTSYNVVQGNTSYNNMGTGMTINGTTGVTSGNNQVTSNTFYNNTGTPADSDGLNINGDLDTGNVVQSNTIYGNADDGIDCWSSSGNTIEKNIVYNHTGPGDGNGIKMGGSTTGGNNTVRYNISYGNVMDGFDANGSGGNLVYNNIAYNNGSIGFEDGYRTGGSAGCPGTARCQTAFKNNIGFNNTTSNFNAYNETTPSDYNLWYSSGSNNAHISYNYSAESTIASFTTTSGGLDAHSLSADPVFVSTGTPDFRLQKTSTAINAGTSVSLTSDYSNNTVPQGANPDIGALEFLVPSAGSSLAQYKSDGSTSVSTGAWTNQTTVVLKFSMSSTNSNDTLTPQVEVKAIGNSFTNSATDTGSSVAYSGSPVTGTVTITGLTSGTTYHWQARVSNPAGDGAWTSYGGNAESSADFGIDTTAPTTPGTPSTTTPTSSTTPTWTWTASTDSASGLASPAYTVQWSQDSAFLTGVTSSTAATNAFTHSSGLAQGTWYFRVKATDAQGNVSSNSSNGSVLIDTTAPTTPGTPSTTTPTGSATPTWTWSASTDGGSGLASPAYTVYWSQDSAFLTGVSNSTASSATFTHSISLTSGTWYFRVKATDLAGNVSSYSSNGSVVVDVTVPTTPGTPSASTPATDTTPTWNWTASTDSGVGLASPAYTVYWSQDSAFLTGVSFSTASSNTFTHSSTLAEGTWYFRVKAADSVGNVSSFSSNGSVVIDTGAPTTPGTPSASTPATDTTPTWSWTASTDAGSGLASPAYTVEWSTDATFLSGVNSSTAVSNTFTHSIALAETTWYFRVKATDNLGNVSSYSSNGSITIDTVVAPSLISSSNYKLHDFATGGGGGDTTNISANYGLNAMIGELADQQLQGTTYSLGPGVLFTRQANTPAAPALSNPSSYYDKLLLVIDNGNNPSDATFAVAISSDNFVTTQYVKSDMTVGATLTTTDYLTYAGWGSTTGSMIIGLMPNTTYKVKVKAMQGQFTETGYSLTASAATTVPSLTYDLDVSATDSETSSPYSLNIGQLTPSVVTTATDKIWVDISTNGAYGAQVSIRGNQSGLYSASSSKTITSATADLAGATEGFGLQVATSTQSSGGPLLDVSPYDGSGQNVGVVDTTYRSILDSAAAITGGRASILVKTKISAVTPAAPDYADTLTVVAAARF